MRTKYMNFELESEYKGDKVWDADDRCENRNRHVITVKNLGTGKKTQFDFWESISEIEIKTEDQLLFAFRCFVDDAISGDMDIEDFFDEFGYCEDGKTVKRGFKAYKGCQKSRQKFNDLMNGNFAKAYDILDQMSKDGIE